MHNMNFGHCNHKCDDCSKAFQYFLCTDETDYVRVVSIYHKIPKISPGAYILQRPFSRGLFLEGLLFGGAYLRREICVSKSIGLAL